MQWKLLTGLALSLSALHSPLAADTPPPAHYLANGDVPPQLIALRSHLLDWPWNELLFRNMDQMWDTRQVSRSGPVRAFPHADVALPEYDYKGGHYTEDQFEDRTYTNALLVIRDGRIIHESYRNNSTAASHFLSMSMAKSVTAILIGIAVDKGYIKSIDQPVTDYLPELKGSGYDGTTIRNLLMMRSGVDYEERYDFGATPSLAARMFLEAIVKNKERFTFPAATIGRKWAPGSHFNYSTLDTGVLGWLLSRAVKEPLAEFQSRMLWEPMGMESDGFWLMDGKPGAGRELNGMGFNATLRDYGRLGQMMLEDGQFNGQQILSADWVRQATTITPFADRSFGVGYGFQFWKLDDAGDYTALGLQGQFIYVSKKTHTVIVKMSFFPREETPEAQAATEETLAYFKTLVNWSGGHGAS